MNQVICNKCKGANNPDNKFCSNCGTILDGSVQEDLQEPSSSTKTIRSSGNYSGKMIKGKKSKGWKIFRNIIIGLVLLGVLALVIWFQVDPDAGKKLTDALMGIAFMAVFFFVGWIFMRGKKGKTNYDWDDDQYSDVADDDD